MAIDTREKRASTINVSLPWRGQWPLPDGTIGAADRLQIAGWYSGIAAAEPASVQTFPEGLESTTLIDLMVAQSVGSLVRSDTVSSLAVTQTVDLV